MNKYTITLIEHDPLDGELLEVIEFEAPCLTRKRIKILLWALNKGPNRDIFAEIDRNGEPIGFLHLERNRFYTMLGIHLSSRHYVKIS